MSRHTQPALPLVISTPVLVDEEPAVAKRLCIFLVWAAAYPPPLSSAWLAAGKKRADGEQQICRQLR